DNEVRLWEVPTGTLLHRLKHPGGPSLLMFCLGKGETLVSTEGQSIWLWDVKSGKKLREVKLPETPLLPQNSLAVSPDGKTVAFGSYKGTIFLWELASDKELRSLPGHEGWISCLSFSPDGKVLAVASTKTSERGPEGETVRL